MKLTEELIVAAENFVCAEYDVQMLHSLGERLSACLDLPGDIVVYGCQHSNVAAWFSQILVSNKSDKKIYIFEPFAIDTVFTAKCAPADLDSVERDAESGTDGIMELFSEKGLPCPEIVAGWFKDTAADTPAEVCFVHIACSIHEELLEAYLGCYDKLTPGAVVCIQNYGSGFSPCIKNSTNEFLFSKPESAELLLHNSVGQYAAFQKCAEEEVASETSLPEIEDQPVSSEPPATESE